MKPQFNTRRAFARILPAGAFLAFFAQGRPLLAQFTFSIDYHGPTRAVADSMFGFPISEGDILTPSGGTPAMPIVPGALPVPEIFISAGVGPFPPVGLSIATHFPCIGAGPGLTPCPAIPIGTVELDALSYGTDGPVVPGAFNTKSQWHFSVDEFAFGFPGPVTPNVTSEGLTVSPFVDSAADVFVDGGIFAPLPLPPFATPPANTGVIDGNGRLSAGSIFAYPGIGLIEPTTPGLPPDLGDNLDAMDVDGLAYPATSFPAYFSMDASFVDPRNGWLNSGTALANGFAGGDVLVVGAAGALPAVFAPAFMLGLDFVGGPDSDDLDALILFENGSGVFEPSLTPFDWLGGGTDMLLFSVRAGSAIIGTPDSMFGIPIEAGDILTTPMGPTGTPPAIFLACENLGLDPGFARGGFAPFGDDIDALDFVRGGELLAQEYCYGDGGFSVGCTSCPCGNDMPAGNQTGCMNSAGTGARLTATGMADVSSDTLEFNITGGTPLGFAVLLAADSRLPTAGACPPGSGIFTPLSPLDGLRCIGVGISRHGGRALDAAGSNIVPWGGAGPPAIGLIAQGGYVVCQTRQFQVIYRDVLWGTCSTGLNTSSAVQVTFGP